MSKREAFVEAGRAMLGTPYKSKARTPGIGVDCAGHLICAARAAGLREDTFDIQDYTAHAVDGRIMRHCEQHLERIDRGEMRAGDLVVVSWGRVPQHIGMVAQRGGALTIVHAENVRKNAVVEHRLVFGDSAMRFVAAFRVPGIDE